MLILVKSLHKMLITWFHKVASKILKILYKTLNNFSIIIQQLFNDTTDLIIIIISISGVNVKKKKKCECHTLCRDMLYKEE